MRYLFFFVLQIVSALGMLTLHSDLPSPYNQVSPLLPFNDFGWYGNETLMEELIQNRNVTTIIEVGSLLGKSTRHLAASLPIGGHVYAVDHWLGSAEHQQGQWAPLPIPLDQMYNAFLSNVIHANLTDVIIPIRKPSLEAASTLDVMADLIFIDASHDTESVLADLNAWYPHLKMGGVLVGDDMGWRSVRVAVQCFAKEHPELLFEERCGLAIFYKDANR